MNAYDIIKKPVITEKSELLRKEYNKYTFEVNPKANKFQIRNAVQELFNVKVLTVATMNYKPVTKKTWDEIVSNFSQKESNCKIGRRTYNYLF